MKLMGTGKLHTLAMGGNRAVARAASLLRAELIAFEWGSPREVAGDYPNACVHGHRVEIGLPEENCVVLAINYRAGVALIEFAGPRTGASSPSNRKKRKIA